MTRSLAAAFLSVLMVGMACLFTVHLASGALWRIPVEVTTMPCTIRPGTAVEFFFPALHQGLAGIGLEVLPDGRQRVDLEVSTVPGDSLIARSRMASRRGELVGRIPVQPLAPKQMLRARLEAAGSGSSVFLHCVSVAGPGGSYERPVAHTYHTLGSSLPGAFIAWLKLRVAPLVPPGALAMAWGFMVGSLLVAASTAVAVAMMPGAACSDETDDGVP